VKVRQLKTNFVAGEFDPLLQGRSDIKHYYNAAERARNVIVIPEGGVSMRPGSRYIATVDDIPAIDGGGNSVVRLAEFQFNTEQTYMIVFSHKKISIFRNRVLVATLAAPWSSADLKATYTPGGDLIQSGINWTQSKDTMLVFHQSYGTRQLKRGGSHFLWTLTDFQFKNIPRYNFGSANYSTPLAVAATHPIGAGGAPANLTDGNPATVSQVNGIGNLTGAAAAARAVIRVDLGAVIEIGGANLKAAKVTTGSSVNQSLQYSLDGVTYFPIGDTFLVDATARNISRSQRVTCRYVAWILDEANYTGMTIEAGEIEIAPYTTGANEVQEIEFPAPGSQGDWTENDTFALILEDEQTANIRYRGNADRMAANLQTALRNLPNVSRTGITVTHSGNSASLTSAVKFTVTFGGDDGNRPWGSLYYQTISVEQVPSIDVFVVSAGARPGEYVWSATRGYPRCGTFFQGRLWVAGTNDLPNWAWASRPGGENDFNSERFADDYGIAIPADADDVPAILNIYAGRHLQFFMTSGEYYIPVSETQAVTPANAVMRRTTSRGSKAGMRVFEVDGATHFIQRRGKALRELIFADTEQAYQANNISLLAPHLMRDPVDFALRRSISTNDADYEFMPNSDGTMTVFCVLRTQEVNALVLWLTNGDYQSVAVVLDDVFFAVRRTVNGVSKVMIEAMDADLTVDCALAGEGAAGALLLAHLPNSPIEHILDGAIQQQVQSDAAGLATFFRPAVNSWSAGLRFALADPETSGSMIWLVKTLPVEMETQQGAIMGKKRRIVDLSVRLYETTALIVQGNRISFQSYGSNLLDQPVTPYTGVKNIRGLLGWSHTGSVLVGSDQSMKATLLGLSMAVSV
jgi:hypothetical protein